MSWSRIQVVPTRTAGRAALAALAAALFATALVLLPGRSADAQSAWPTAPQPADGFQDRVALTGLHHPTVVEFTPSGSVFVAEKKGTIKVFRNLQDDKPITFADLRDQVFNNWDRGLLGLAIPPGFETDAAKRWVYVLYTYNRSPVDGRKWPNSNPNNPDVDECPSPRNFMVDGCEVLGRLSRLRAEPTTDADGRPDGGWRMTGDEQVLIEDWCQQFPIHSIGGLEFGRDGALYVSAGDGASFGAIDTGRLPGGNPCRDPLDPDPNDANGTRGDQGGSFRSLDLRTAGDAVGLDGTVLRIDPETGAGLPGNPLFGSDDANAARIVAIGLRNPLRMAPRPNTGELWVGDVGWKRWEEINRIADLGGAVEDFGWPCYEGNGPQGEPTNGVVVGYPAHEICETNTSGARIERVGPWFTYDHDEPLGCRPGSSSVTGLAFYDGGLYPDRYDGALFFADSTRGCIWAALPGADGVPDPNRRELVIKAAATPVDLVVGPAGDIFYSDLNGGTIRRVQYVKGNRTPLAAFTASPAAGPAPLTVRFDAGDANDPDGDTDLRFEWDLDGDGAFDDATGPTVEHTFATAGVYTVKLRVTDSLGASHVAQQRIDANGAPPEVAITAPDPATKWTVGEKIAFSGWASDPEDGRLPGSALEWTLVLHHCEGDTTNCHEHHIGQYGGTDGSFLAPDHDYPSYLELRLKATDSQGLSTTRSIQLHPRTTKLTFASDPAGLQLAVNGATRAAPFTQEVIVGSRLSVGAPATQERDGVTWKFARWSDRGKAAHDLTAPAEPVTYTATFTRLVGGAPSTAASSTSSTTTTTTTTTTSTTTTTTTTVGSVVAPETTESTTTTTKSPTSTTAVSGVNPVGPGVAEPGDGGDAAEGDGDGLPRSGPASVVPLLVVGLSLIGLGTLGVLGARRGRANRLND